MSAERGEQVQQLMPGTVTITPHGLLVDGVEFPWLIVAESVSVVPGPYPEVRLSIFCERVDVRGSVP